MNNTLFIIRGIPGSGKSTEAKKLLETMPGARHFEADMFFEKDGEYKFNAAQIKSAHQWCQDQVFDSLKNGYDVIVCNTFVKRWEMERYLEMARKLNISFEIKKMAGNYQNVHGVPGEVVARMRANFEE